MGNKGGRYGLWIKNRLNSLRMERESRKDNKIAESERI
jgi:hypothetical protein